MKAFPRVYLYLLILFLTSVQAASQESFKTEQLKYKRVREAYMEKEAKTTQLLKAKKVDPENFEILLCAYKYEQELEVWAKNRGTKSYHLIITYEFCSSSGKLGPKRKQGDYQIPEGIYHIDRFNPVSNFHLSLGINYPNKSDRIRGDKTNPGGDIFIHGDCVTIGCIPITDDRIKELYILAVGARTAGQQKIPVMIFPFRMNESEFVSFTTEFKIIGPTLKLWKELKPIYEFFKEKHYLPETGIGKSGNYFIN